MKLTYLVTKVRGKYTVISYFKKADDLLGTVSQSSDGNVFKMAAPLTVYMCELLIILEFVSDFKL